jgi:hypothetical protein
MVSDLAVSTPAELIAGDYADNSPIEADIETVFQLVTKAKKALMESGVLDREFCSAEQILEKRSQLVRFTTGSKDLDAFLKGGVESRKYNKSSFLNFLNIFQICIYLEYML